MRPLLFAALLVRLSLALTGLPLLLSGLALLLATTLLALLLLFLVRVLSALLVRQLRGVLLFVGSFLGH